VIPITRNDVQRPSRAIIFHPQQHNYKPWKNRLVFACRFVDDLSSDESGPLCANAFAQWKRGERNGAAARALLLMHIPKSKAAERGKLPVV